MNTLKQLVFSEVSDPVERAILLQTLNSGSEKEKSEFKHIWQIADYLRCPIIGTCLSPAEQKQI